MALSVFIRLAMRYLAGALVAKGFMAPEMGDIILYDPEVNAAIQIGAGVAIGAVTEYAYAIARRLGWST